MVARRIVGVERKSSKWLDTCNILLWKSTQEDAIVAAVKALGKTLEGEAAADPGGSLAQTPLSCFDD